MLFRWRWRASFKRGAIHPQRPRRAVCGSRISPIALYLRLSAIDVRQGKLLRERARRKASFPVSKPRSVEDRIFESIEEARTETFSYIDGVRPESRLTECSI